MVDTAMENRRAALVENRTRTPHNIEKTEVLQDNMHVRTHIKIETAQLIETMVELSHEDR